jgi:ABC-type multidrug transport system ATPase subunit
MQLTITNLNKTYSNGVHAINNVNLTINQGMFGLLGPNGAGKSSLMRTIATLQEADLVVLCWETLMFLPKR